MLVGFQMCNVYVASTCPKWRERRLGCDTIADGCRYNYQNRIWAPRGEQLVDAIRMRPHTVYGRGCELARGTKEEVQGFQK